MVIRRWDTLTNSRGDRALVFTMGGIHMAEWGLEIDKIPTGVAIYSPIWFLRISGKSRNPARYGIDL